MDSLNAGLMDDPHPIANAIVSLTGVAYFAAWSISFYPQVILNYQRKKTTGLSADMIVLNPIGHLAITIWSWGAYYSSTARKQYAGRHHGHLPQVTKSDLAFSLHAFIISSLTFFQVVYYAWKNRPSSTKQTSEELETQTETDPLIPRPNGGTKLDLVIPISTIIPSIPCQLSLAAIGISTLISAVLVWSDKTVFLDWLYFVSTLKLLISVVKYMPQVLLNYRLKSTEGLAIGVILLDLAGAFLSFAQLVVSSMWVDGDPSGIVANPAKLGLAGLSMIFDFIFIVQNYWLYTDRREEDRDGEQ